MSPYSLCTNQYNFYVQELFLNRSLIDRIIVDMVIDGNECISIQISTLKIVRVYIASRLNFL